MRVSKKRPTYAELGRQLADALNRGRRRLTTKPCASRKNCRIVSVTSVVLEQQKAPARLGLIAGSAINVQAVLNAVADSAARLCKAEDVVIYRVSGDLLERVAIRGSNSDQVGGPES